MRYYLVTLRRTQAQAIDVGAWRPTIAGHRTLLRQQLPAASAGDATAFAERIYASAGWRITGATLIPREA